MKFRCPYCERIATLRYEVMQVVRSTVLHVREDGRPLVIDQQITERIGDWKYFCSECLKPLSVDFVITIEEPWPIT